MDRRAALSPRAEAIEKRHAPVELLLGNELVRRMRLCDVARADDDRWRPRLLKETGFGRIGDRVRLVGAGKAQSKCDGLGRGSGRERRHMAAASWSSIWYLLSSFAVISYTNNWVYVLFAAIGSWIGAYASMTYLHGPPSHPPGAAQAVARRHRLNLR